MLSNIQPWLTHPRDQLTHHRTTLQYYTTRLLLILLSTFLYTHVLTTPNTHHPPTWPLSTTHLNNATLGFEHILHLTSSDKLPPGSKAYFSLPIHSPLLLPQPTTTTSTNTGILTATVLRIDPHGPKRKAHTAAITEILDKGYSTTLIIEENLGINARTRPELHAIHRALRARPLYEDMHISDLHKLRGYYDNPDTMLPLGPQPHYHPYYRNPPSKEISIDDYTFTTLVTGSLLGTTKDHHTSSSGAQHWDIIFLGDCREEFDEEAQRKLRATPRERGEPWRRLDWVGKRAQTSDLWFVEKGEAEREGDRRWLRARKRKEQQKGKQVVVEVEEEEEEREELLSRQGLRRVEGGDDVCLLAYVVSRRGAGRLRELFGASDPGVGTRELLGRFCGGGGGGVCLGLAEGVVRARKARD